jgi:hypothetical protein
VLYSQFHVLKFDPSASEIEYLFVASTIQQVEDMFVPILRKVPTNQGSKRERPETNMQESVEILEDDDDIQAMCKNQMTRYYHRMMPKSNQIKKIKRIIILINPEIMCRLA